MQKSIITLLTLALILLGASTGASAQFVFNRLESFFVAGAGSPKNIITSRVTFSRLSWIPSGTVTSCSIKMEESSDGLTWADLTPLQDCAVAGDFEFITPSFLGQFIRFNVPTLAGGGNLIATVEGFRGTECGRSYSGIFSVVSGSDPAVGVELSITIPASERWRVYSASFELQASGVLADREVFLTASEGGNEYFRVFADGVVKADQKGIFTTAALGFVGTAGLGPSSINQPTDVRTVMIPIYSDAFIPGGHTLATDTNGLQSGDDYSPAMVLVEKCPN